MDQVKCRCYLGVTHRKLQIYLMTAAQPFFFSIEDVVGGLHKDSFRFCCFCCRCIQVAANTVLLYNANCIPKVLMKVFSFI